MTAAPIAAAAPRSRLWSALAGWALFLVVETITQVVFKYAGAGLDDDHGFGPLVVHAAASPVVWAAFGLYFLGFVLWLTILKDVDLGRAFPMTASIYVATLAAAVLLFHESLSPVRILGVLAIVGGVVMLASDEDTGAKGDGLKDASPVHG